MNSLFIVFGYWIFSGGRNYMLLPLHSQIPREDQHRVFMPVPPGVTKVNKAFFSLGSLACSQPI